MFRILLCMALLVACIGLCLPAVEYVEAPQDDGIACGFIGAGIARRSERRQSRRQARSARVGFLGGC